jgi:hypothetical protein
MEHVQVFYPQEHSEMVMKGGAGVCSGKKRCWTSERIELLNILLCLENMISLWGRPCNRGHQCLDSRYQTLTCAKTRPDAM